MAHLSFVRNTGMRGGGNTILLEPYEWGTPGKAVDNQAWLAFREKEDRMNTGTMWGWIGGIFGGVIGLAGGVVGTYFSIKNTNGPRERSFMVQSAAVCWIATLTFLGLLFALPNPYRWFVWIPYSILLPIGIIYGNRRQQAIKQEESQNKSDKNIGE